jgi:hypothetical protein
LLAALRMQREIKRLAGYLSSRDPRDHALDIGDQAFVLILPAEVQDGFSSQAQRRHANGR